MAFAIEHEHGSDVVTVRVAGDIDLHTAPRLRDALLAVTPNSQRVVVDMAGVSFLDSMGIGVLVGALKRARQSGGELVLVECQAPISQTLTIAGLAAFFGIEEDPEQATATPGGRER